MSLITPEKILILGCTGLLGASLAPVLKGNGYEVEVHGHTKTSRYTADLTEFGATLELLNKICPSVIINLVGLTNVDQCENHPNQAYLVNVRTVENIAAWIRQQSKPCHLIHISTDQVYDGASSHTEEQVTLTNYYAFSKYAGELAAAVVPGTILRTNFFGLSHCAQRVSLSDWLFQAFLSGQAIQVFDDVFFTPLSMQSLSELIALVVKNKPNGVFNLGSCQGMSKADFAYYFAESLGLSTHEVSRASVDQAINLKAYRPKDMRMDCSKFEQTLGVKLPILRDEINRVSKEYL
ncbi:MAG: SDR family oxidoreductase [Methylococcales bacterium]|nr:SDR family oxidoreductase [Methylococcaceae bacterium]